MIIALLFFVFSKGCSTFTVKPVERFVLADGSVYMGEVAKEETFRPTGADLVQAQRDRGVAEPYLAAARQVGVSEEVIRQFAEAPTPDEKTAAARTLEDAMTAKGVESRRYQVRVGNKEYSGEHFAWLTDLQIVERSEPEWAVVVERLSRGQAAGRFYGVPVRYRIEDEVIAEGPEATWAAIQARAAEIEERRQEAEDLKSGELGDIRDALEEARLALRVVELDKGPNSESYAAERERYRATKQRLDAENARITAQLGDLQDANDRYFIDFEIAQREEAVSLHHADIVRAYPPGRLSDSEKRGVYMSRWGEFLTDDPREANQEGGVFPAIFGTVVMTLLMCLLVVPFGVLAALYLREYAKQGALVSLVRVAVNNLAGVPSIVFGVFGLGFFCYIIGANIDELLFEASLPNPTFGKGGLLWASLTLALLTLPVVIVATEEALAAVPQSMREGSYACGASKWQTIRRIVLPRAGPGILTGMILAVARGAGEVAPLMLVGVSKLAPALPIDGSFPFVHGSRSFMHLGFHIYDVGFQSPNAEAAKPMMFTTTLLLILIVVALNITGVWIRARLSRRFQGV
jgi:phosphate transport system permease protein